MNTIAIFNGPITPANNTKFQTMLHKFDRGGSITLALSTLDGDFSSAISLALFLQKRFTFQRLVVSSVCQGPGVVLVHNADELVFGVKGQIGPIAPTHGATDGVTLDRISATGLGIEICELKVADQERINALDRYSSIPLVHNTFIGIADEAGKREEYTDCGEYPILRTVDVFRHYGLHGY
ncbi:hypothetical protein GF108_03200 [Phyllobacterium sp. SYP-B3895]|uniref:hypothetical protein n=1 Tax=Phyllobacterium sp. SYP-B3895 TaxID=2663240 RepID=UPI001299D7B0|nr:hypothetical protein [Phyllobacterium sp. SYP-B3895]MRG54590.1 hypothetical protein [Phyllobacterium sp. SYP-B3895]